MNGKITVDGVDFHLLKIITEKMIEFDDAFRKHGKTIFYNRESVDRAYNEMLDAMNRAKDWTIHINREITDEDGRYLELPKRVHLNPDKVLFGLPSVLCKSMDFIEDKYAKRFAKSYWKRFLLYYRRRIGGKKSAWRKRGFIAKYEEAPDLRDQKFHKGSKLIYDLKEVN